MKNTVALSTILLVLSLVVFAAVFPLFYSVEYSDILAVSPVAFAVLCPLCEAAKTGNLLGVQEALQNGVSVNSYDEDTNTALMGAAQNGHNIIVLELLKNKDVIVDYKNKDGDTALMKAAENGQREATITLLKYQPNIDIINNSGKSALDFAKNKPILHAIFTKYINYIVKDIDITPHP